MKADEMAERKARIARMVADRITDKMLLSPINELTDGEVAMLQVALRGPHGEEITARMDRLNERGEGSP